MENLEKISLKNEQKKKKNIVREIIPSGPSLPSKNLLTNLTSIKIPDSLLSQNFDSNGQTQNFKMNSQFDPQEKIRLQSSFNESLREIDNDQEKTDFIAEGNEKNNPEAKIKEFEKTIKKVDNRLSLESITSKSLKENPEYRHLYDSSVTKRFSYIKPKQKTKISVAELLNQSVEEKIGLRPKDPMEYVNTVLGRTYTPYVPNLDRYKPIKSVDDILRERGEESLKN